jgi:rod shape-determining protein MreD
MKIAKIVILIYLTALFSLTILPKLTIFHASPNLILTIAIFFLFQNEIKKGFFWGILGGLFLDLLGVGFPYNISITTVIVLLTYFLIRKYFESSNILIFLTFCFVGNLIYSSLFAIALQHLTVVYFPIINAAYSTFLGLILFLIKKRDYDKSIFPFIPFGQEEIGQRRVRG